MHKEDLNKFLDGEQNPEQLQIKLVEDTVEKDFIVSYQKVIEENKTEVPDFNPFEKIEVSKKKRFSVVKQLLPFAASILFAISTFLFFQNSRSNETNLILSEQELIEIQENTEMALLHFSKELNACFAKFDDAKAMQLPITKFKQLSELKIELDNPLNNLKYN